MILRFLRNVFVYLWTSPKHNAEVYNLKHYVKSDGVLYKYNGQNFVPIKELKK